MLSKYYLFLTALFLFSSISISSTDLKEQNSTKVAEDCLAQENELLKAEITELQKKYAAIDRFNRTPEDYKNLLSGMEDVLKSTDDSFKYFQRASLYQNLVTNNESMLVTNYISNYRQTYQDPLALTENDVINYQNFYNHGLNSPAPTYGERIDFNNSFNIPHTALINDSQDDIYYNYPLTERNNTNHIHSNAGLPSWNNSENIYGFPTRASDNEQGPTSYKGGMAFDFNQQENGKIYRDPSSEDNTISRSNFFKY